MASSVHRAEGLGRRRPAADRRCGTPRRALLARLSAHRDAQALLSWAPFADMRMVATKDEFDQLVAASASQALFVDFTASWCGP